jgi:Mg2+ and Co2+ transporter CorA
MPRPASQRKAQSARRSGPVPVKQAVKKKRSSATAVKTAKTTAKAAKGNGAVRTESKPSPRDVRAGIERRGSEKVLHAGRGAAATESASSASRGKYVYCIIESNDPLRFGPIGVGADPSDVYTVHYRNLAAVVSDAPLEVLDSTRENVLAHERVNETVMHEHTVIPMSFGTIFKTREDIVELLRSAAEAFGDVLNKMQNKLEFGLKVLWDRDQAVREVENADEDISRLKKEISGQKGPTYFARMQYGRLIDSALQSRSERYVADVLDQLRDVSVASRINKPIGDKMIMNAAFLIARDQEAAFDARVKMIATRFDKLTFKYTGPWPPYNFVNIRLKLERA